MKTNNTEIIQEEKQRKFKLKMLEFFICNRKGHNRDKSNTIYRQSKHCLTCHKHISLW